MPISGGEVPFRRVMSTCAGPSFCMTMVTPHARAPVPAGWADDSGGRGAHCDGNDLITGVTAQRRRRGLSGRTAVRFSPRTEASAARGLGTKTRPAYSRKLTDKLDTIRRLESAVPTERVHHRQK